MDETSLRDDLALVRTHLANERTLLAYVRTALAMLGGGAALLHFFPGDDWLWGIAWCLLICGSGTLLAGIRRYIRVKARLKADTSESNR